MRLQKYLSQCGVASRRQAEKFIESGRVKVNGATVTVMGQTIVPGVDRVQLDGEYLETAVPGLLLLNKPKQVITTCEDTHGRKTVLDFLPEEYQSYFPVGRLDADTTGLVIMTNDGELADYLTHPRYEIPRIYIADVVGKFNVATVKKIAQGIELEDGPVNAQIKILASSDKNSRVEVQLHVGRKHIVRRLLDAVGHPVIELTRTMHGPFTLGHLQLGQIKIFKPSEYQRYRLKVVN